MHRRAVAGGTTKQKRKSAKPRRGRKNQKSRLVKSNHRKTATAARPEVLNGGTEQEASSPTSPLLDKYSFARGVALGLYSEPELPHEPYGVVSCMQQLSPERRAQLALVSGSGSRGSSDRPTSAFDIPIMERRAYLHTWKKRDLSEKLADTEMDLFQSSREVESAMRRKQRAELRLSQEQQLASVIMTSVENIESGYRNHLEELNSLVCDILDLNSEADPQLITAATSPQSYISNGGGSVTTPNNNKTSSRPPARWGRDQFTGLYCKQRISAQMAELLESIHSSPANRRAIKKRGHKKRSGGGNTNSSSSSSNGHSIVSAMNGGGNVLLRREGVAAYRASIAEEVTELQGVARANLGTIRHTLQSALMRADAAERGAESLRQSLAEVRAEMVVLRTAAQDARRTCRDAESRANSISEIAAARVESHRRESEIARAESAGLLEQLTLQRADLDMYMDGVLSEIKKKFGFVPLPLKRLVENSRPPPRMRFAQALSNQQQRAEEEAVEERNGQSFEQEALWEWQPRKFKH